MAKATRGSRAKESALPKAAPDAALDAAAEAQVPLEAAGPTAEHEDHEGGMTDSLARKGVRYIPDAEEREEALADAESVIRAPSVRDRQALNTAALVQGGMRGARVKALPPDASAKEKAAFAAGVAAARGIQPGSVEVPVVATRLGQYPADGRLRAPGEAFIYIMGPEEEELPSWMEDPTGKIPTRDLFAVRAENSVTATIQVRKDGTTEIV